MGSRLRRTLLRGIATLAAGSTLAGLLGTSAATPEAATLHDTTQHGAATTLTARIDPAIREWTGVPDAVAPIWTDLTARYRSIDPDAVGPVSVSLSLDGETVAGGCATASGGFTESELREELLSDGGASFEPAETSADRGSRFVAADSPYAVGVAGSTVTVGYAPTDRAALSHVDSAFESDAFDSRSGAVGTPSSLEGDAVSYATLGPRTRSWLLDRVRESAGNVATVVRSAEALGVALDVGSDRTRIEYGVVADPESLSARDLWRLATETENGDAVEAETVSRHGRLIVLEATVETGSLWAVHERLFGSLSA